MPGSDHVELVEDRLLHLHFLGHGLDHEVDVAETVVLGRSLDPADDLLELLVGLLLGDLLLLDEAPELTLADLAGLLEPLVDELLLHVLEGDGQAGGGDHLRDLASHRAGAHDGGFENEHALPWCSRVESPGGRGSLRIGAPAPSA